MGGGKGGGSASTVLGHADLFATVTLTSRQLLCCVVFKQYTYVVLSFNVPQSNVPELMGTKDRKYGGKSYNHNSTVYTYTRSVYSIKVEEFRRTK